MKRTARAYDSRRKPRFEIGWLFVTTAGIWLLCSCSFVEQAMLAPRMPEASSPQVFKSESILVCRLDKDRTPSELARTYLGDNRRSWVVEDANEGTAFSKGTRIVIPLEDENKGGLRANGYQTVPILCYHGLADSCASKLCMSHRDFDRQMHYLKSHHYRVISLAELVRFLDYEQHLPRRAVVVTFDDGYRSFYDVAYPVLKQYGFTATLFVYTDFIGHAKSALTWDQLRELKAEGFEIGSHSVSHSDLTRRKKGERYPDYLQRVQDELGRSKEIIDRELAQDTVYVAFPFGRNNPDVVRLSEATGYRLGLSVTSGGNPFFADPLKLKRNQIIKRDLKSFASRLVTFRNMTLE